MSPDAGRPGLESPVAGSAAAKPLTHGHDTPPVNLTPAQVALSILRRSEEAARVASREGDRVSARRLAVAAAREVVAAGPDVVAAAKPIIDAGQTSAALMLAWIDVIGVNVKAGR